MYEGAEVRHVHGEGKRGRLIEGKAEGWIRW